jgi:hypothetical protein
MRRRGRLVNHAVAASVADATVIGIAFWLSFVGGTGGSLPPRFGELRHDSIAVAVVVPVIVLWLSGYYRKSTSEPLTLRNVAAAGSAACAGVFAVWVFARVVDPAAAVGINGSIPTYLPVNVAVLHGIMSFLLLLGLQWLAETSSARAHEKVERAGSSEVEVVP